MEDFITNTLLMPGYVLGCAFSCGGFVVAIFVPGFFMTFFGIIFHLLFNLLLLAIADKYLEEKSERILLFIANICGE